MANKKSTINVPLTEEGIKGIDAKIAALEEEEEDSVYTPSYLETLLVEVQLAQGRVGTVETANTRARNDAVVALLGALVAELDGS